jgi:hypothetical protein
MKASDERQRDAKAKDKEEINQKRVEYREYIEWKDRGIVHDLEQHFQVANPTLSLLLPIALSMSSLIRIPIGRQEKRRKELLIGWLNKNYAAIQKYIPRMVIRDEKGDVKGPNVDTWNRFSAEHPDADVISYLNKS